MFGLGTMKTRIFRYLLTRYFGQYLEAFSEDQLKTELTNGKCSIEKLQLNIQALNELSEEYNLPFEFLHGSIDLISITVPIAALLQKNTEVEFKGLCLVVQPKERPQDVSMFDSMWGSMTSSLQLAEECLNSKEVEEDEEYESSNSSVEHIAKMIDAVLANLKIIFRNSSLKIEHISGNGSCGIALEIKLGFSEYFDEAGVNPNQDTERERPTIESSTHSYKKVVFREISLFTSKFSTEAREFPVKGAPTSDCMDAGFYPSSPEMPPPHFSLPMKKADGPAIAEEPILISKLPGQQELRLILKQDEAALGPKVDVEFNLTALNLFLIPQQVHILYELLRGVIKPNSNNRFHQNRRPSATSKPMKPADFALVEQEILSKQNRSQIPSKSLKNQHGWSSHYLDEYDENFQLMAKAEKPLPEVPFSPPSEPDSLTSSVTSDVRSDCTGASLGNQRMSRQRGSSVQAMLQDQQSELTHFHGRCGSVCIIILQDDSVRESQNHNSHSFESITASKLSLQERAESFFEDMATLQNSGLDFRDFSSIRDSLSNLCNTSHLRLLGSTVSFEGNEKSTSAQWLLNFSLSVFDFQVLECLFNVNEDKEPTYVEILSHKGISISESGSDERAGLKMKYQQIKNTSQSRSRKPPIDKLELELGDVVCELDISLADRIQTLLNFPNSEDDPNDSQSSQTTQILISSSSVVLNLRFPIPDLRPAHDMDRVPWWQPNLHPEILTMEMKVVTLKTTLVGDFPQTIYDIQCRELHGLFKNSEEGEAISFLRVFPDGDETSQNLGFDWPRLVIKVSEPTFGVNLDTGGFKEMECSMAESEILMSGVSNGISPFVSSTVAYGSKLRCKSDDEDPENNNNGPTENDEVIKPADKNTIQQFIEETVNRSEYLFEFFFPTANIILPSKDFFELLYNRLGNDLLLWKRTVIKPNDPYDSSAFKVNIPGFDMSTHSMRDSNLGNYPFRPFTNDSDSEDEESNYCSVYEYCQRQKQKYNPKIEPISGYTKLSITIAITKGSLTIHTPVMDVANEILPEMCGKMQLLVEDGQIFIASSYKGDPNEAYLCILADKSNLYHYGLTPKPVSFPVVSPFTGSKPCDMSCIIYESEQKVPSKYIVCDTKEPSDMLKIAVHIVHSPKQQQLKSFKVAIDITDATLRHFMNPSSQMWINQLIDYLKLHDFPVSGYTPAAVVTELHLNLSTCAIDYRPLHLPLKAMVTVDNFNMSCNIAATTPSFLFRLISEEMRLFLSNIIPEKKVDLLKNYVCVVDSGLIDVSFRTSVNEKNEAHLELSATNNIIHVRTCADSFKALMDLIIYISNHGDIEEEESEAEPQNWTDASPPTSDLDSYNVLKEMKEAMQDCSMDIPSEPKNGELQLSQFDRILSNDDEFCILENDPGVGLIPRNGEPVVRLLTDKPIQIIENYFTVPPGKSDVLKAPKHYPKPDARLILREMSVVWQMYGGSDFKTNPDKRNKKKKQKEATVTFSDEKNVSLSTEKSSVSFCHVNPVMKNSDIDTVQYSMEHITIKPRADSSQKSWLQKGGPNRNHDILMELQLNKVKLQREIYPTNQQYASRYVLVISDVEIRDRCKSSDINKFLYQYSSQKVPRQSNANMIEVKACYTRPDPNCDSEECTLRVSCKPIRLNIDQDSFLFLIDFFGKAMGPSSSESSEENTNNMTPEVPPNTVKNMKHSSLRSKKTFYRVFSFAHDVLIKIDYQGKRVLMEQGALKGVLLGLAQLNSSEIKLKRLCYRHGLLGHDKVLTYALNEWQQDILKNQLPSILGGIGPMHSFVQLFQGVKDLFYLPVVQYQKDGQIVRGFQLGASSFSTSAMMATLDLFSGIVSAIQGAAVLGYDMVSPGPSVANRFLKSPETYRKTSQPADIREGITAAFHVVREGLGDTARKIYSVASAEHEHKGVPGAIGGVLRQIPPSLLKPIILTSEATNYVLGGVRHQLMPDAHQEDIHKWRTKSS